MTQTELERRITTTGVFVSEAAAGAALEQLVHKGYGRDDLTVVAEPQPEVNEPGDVSDRTVTRSYSGLVIGTTVGAVAGALIGLLLALGAVPLPNIELLNILSPLALTLLCAAAGAALGILAGSMAGLSQVRQEAKGLAHEVEAGAWLVSLRHHDPAIAAADLRAAGAIDMRVQTPEPQPLNEEM
jgi:hypothetical protein